MRRILGLAVVVLGCASACGSSSKPAERTKHAEPERCKRAYHPVICAGVDRRCETDENGCERCTCSSPQPLAPSQDGQR